MTIEEFSDQFDALVGVYIHQLPFGISQTPITFDEYEKSLFLTDALELIVKDIYSNNYTGSSFESTEEARRSLDSLVKEKRYSDNKESKESKEYYLTDNRFTHERYTLPDECWFIVYEQCKKTDTSKCSTYTDVVPIRHDEYFRTIKNPFRGPVSNRVLRLDVGEKTVELVADSTIDEYFIRYICKPSPIILTDFSSENITIYKECKPMTSKLPDVLHMEILHRAVSNALMYRQGTKSNNVSED